MVREFGEFLLDELKPKKKQKQQIIPIHQQPKFLIKEKVSEGRDEDAK